MDACRCICALAWRSWCWCVPDLERRRMNGCRTDSLSDDCYRCCRWSVRRLRSVSGKHARGVARYWRSLAFALALALVCAGSILPGEALSVWGACTPGFLRWVRVSPRRGWAGALMLVLSAIVAPMAMRASWASGAGLLYFALVLLLEAGLFGTFTALNFFHWFLFWELSLIPAFFLIKLWGGPKRGRRRHSFSSIRWWEAWRCCWRSWRFSVRPGSMDFGRLGGDGRRRTHWRDR